MRGPLCLYNSRRALYRVFVSPASSGALPLARQLLPLASMHATPGRIADRVRTLTRPSRPPQRGRAAPEETTIDDDDDPKKAYLRRFTTQQSVEASGRGRLPQDHEITDPKIMVLDGSVTEGPMAPAVAMRHLRPEESLRMVKPFIPADKSGRPQELALCKIVNKRDEYARQKEVRDKKKAEAKPKLKVVELSWAIGPHDLETKMRRLADFMAKGHKVELAFGKKKGGKRVDAEDAQAVLKSVKEEIEKLGARESKAAEGTVGVQMRLTVEPKAKK